MNKINKLIINISLKFIIKNKYTGKWEVIIFISKLQNCKSDFFLLHDFQSVFRDKPVQNISQEYK